MTVSEEFSIATVQEVDPPVFTFTEKIPPSVPMTILFERPEIVGDMERERLSNPNFQTLYERIRPALPQDINPKRLGNLASFLWRTHDRWLPSSYDGSIPEVQRHVRGITFAEHDIKRTHLMELPRVGQALAVDILRLIDYEATVTPEALEAINTTLTGWEQYQASTDQPLADQA
jgi:hypothetical protein